MKWNTRKRIKFLNSLNHLLKEKEEHIIARVIEYSQIGENKFKSNDPFTDFMVEVEAEYYIRKKDNPVYTYWTTFDYKRVINKKDYGLLLDNNDWKESYMPELKEPYCWLLHDLIDHSHLRKKIFKLVRIWITVRISDQLGIKIKSDVQKQAAKIKGSWQLGSLKTPYLPKLLSVV